MRSNHSLKKLPLDNFGLYLLCSFFPVITVFHAAFYDFLEPVLLLFRTIVLPMISFYLIRKYSSPLILIFFILYVLLFGFGELVLTTDKFIMNIIFLISFIILFRFGCLHEDFFEPSRLGKSLIYASIILNLLVGTIYIYVLLGIFDVADIYAIFEPDRDPALGSGRFTIGNAIEVPLLATTLTYAGSRITQITRLVIFALILNLTLALVSESRIVIVIASFILISVAFRANNKFFFFLILFTAFYAVISNWDEISIIFNSIIERFYGNDGGSANDRLFTINLAISSLTFFSIIFGEGLTASQQMMLQETGIYRTIEAFGFELLFELGFIGILILIIVLLDGIRRNFFLKTLSSIPLIFIWLQLLFFLPLNPLLPITGFCIGVATFRPYLRKA